MGNRWDNYPPGESGRASAPYLVKHHCSRCGKEWECTMFDELGGAFYQNDENAYCECGEEGEIVD